MTGMTNWCFYYYYYLLNNIPSPIYKEYIAIKCRCHLVRCIQKVKPIQYVLIVGFMKSASNRNVLLFGGGLLRGGEGLIRGYSGDGAY